MLFYPGDRSGTTTRRGGRKKQPRCRDAETDAQHQEDWTRRSNEWAAQWAYHSKNEVRRGDRRPRKQRNCVKAPGLDGFYEEYVTKVEVVQTRRDQVCFNANLKPMDLEGRRTMNSHHVNDEDGKLLRDPGAIRALRVRFFRMLLDAGSYEIRSEITECLRRTPVDTTLRALPTV